MKTFEDPLDRLPPHSIDAEMCMLASMMLDSEIAQEILSEGCSGQWFYITDHRLIFEAIQGMLASNRRVDAVLLRDELKDRGTLDDIGGTAYIGQVLASVPSPAHGLDYMRRVRDKFQLRGIITAGNGAIRAAYSDGANADDVIAQAQADLAKAGDARAVTQAADMTTVMERGVASIKNAMDGKTLIPFGWKVLDRYLGGFAEGEITIVAARPSMGKSTFSRQLAVKVAQGGVGVLYISMEESDEKVGRNLISWRSGIENHHLRRGNVHQSDWAAINQAVTEFSKLPIYLVNGVFDCNRIASLAASYKAKFGVKVLVLDYLQKIRNKNADNQKEYERVTEASDWLARTTKQLKMHTVCLSQLNREVTKRDDKRPGLSDIRASGQIEQDADTILMLHREDYYKPDKPAEHTKLVEIIGAKVRDGARNGTYLLDDYLEYQSFEDVPRDRNIPPELTNALTGNEAA